MEIPSTLNGDISTNTIIMDLGLGWFRILGTFSQISPLGVYFIVFLVEVRMKKIKLAVIIN